jgi:hypothetical protein
MITKPIEGGFKMICATSDHIYGLDNEGNVYFREKAPTSYAYNNTYYADKDKKKEDADEKKAWKKLFMEYKVELSKGGPERSAQPSTEETTTEPADIVIDEPAHKVYKDVETIKRVQQALMDKEFYKKTNKVDGDLGKLTVDGIKAFQKSVNLRETGEIDLTLCNALELNKPEENETVVETEPAIELTASDIEDEEDDNEVYCGA